MKHVAKQKFTTVCSISATVICTNAAAASLLYLMAGLKAEGRDCQPASWRNGS